MTSATDEHLRRLPKVELHCDVEGATKTSTIRELARSHGVTFPVDDPADPYRFTDLNRFLSIYDVVWASLQLPTTSRGARTRRWRTAWPPGCGIARCSSRQVS